MIPAHATLFAAPVHLPALWQDKVGFWTNSAQTFGFNYSGAATLAAQDVSAQPQIQVVDPTAMLAAEETVWQADLRRLSARDLHLIRNDAIKFKILAANVGEGRDDALGDCHGVCLWWAVGGPLSPATQRLSTGPQCAMQDAKTHR